MIELSERERMLRRLASYDFAVTELHIYLDTHPDDTSAAETLRSFESKSDQMRSEFESKFGPLSPMNESGNRWAWISDPWPWDNKMQVYGDQLIQEG